MIRIANKFCRPRNIALAAGFVAAIAVFGLAEVAIAQQYSSGIPGIPSAPATSGAGISESPLPSSPAPQPGEFAPLPNTGPVTGYGPGGLGLPPGAPASPPYH